MKAAVLDTLGGPEVVRVRDWPEPRPGAGEALIRAEFAEVNYPDLLVIAGRYQVRLPLPFIPGRMAVGRVLELGPGITGPAPGTRVIAAMEHGAFAETCVAQAAVLAEVPNDIASAEAAALGLAAQTSWFALTERARLAPGESVLVLGGAGGVGLAAIGIARGLGAGRVIAGVRSEAGAARARAAGADGVLRLGGPGLRERLREDLKALGGPVDVVLDQIGGEATEAALRGLAWSGRLVVVGFAAGEIPALRSNYLLLKNIAVLGLQWSDYRDRRPELVVAAWRFLFRLYREGSLRPLIGGILPLERASDALAAVQRGEGGRWLIDLRDPA